MGLEVYVFGVGVFGVGVGDVFGVGVGDGD